MEETDDRDTDGTHGGFDEALGFILDGELQRLAFAIKHLPDMAVPDLLQSSVMAAIRKRKPTWYRRFFLWARTPRSVAFSPLQISVASALVVLCASMALIPFPVKDPPAEVRLQDRRVPVVFTVSLPAARSVAVVGSFNQWRPEGFEMHDAEHHGWKLALELPEGRHEYAFLVDGKKIIPDPHANFFQNDGFGNRNAVLILGIKNDQVI